MLNVQRDETTLTNHKLDLGLAELKLLEHCPHLRLSDDSFLSLLKTQLLHQAFILLKQNALDFLHHYQLLLLLKRRRFRDELPEVVTEDVYFY